MIIPNRVKINLYSIYDHFPDLFAGLRTPKQIDRTKLIDYIMSECGEFGAIYTQPLHFKRSITTWCNAHYNIWEKIANTLELEYNPLYNKDGTVEVTELGKTDTHVTTINGKRYNTTEQITDDETINSVAAYNSSDWTNRNKTTNSDGTMKNTEEYTSDYKHTLKDTTTKERDETDGWTSKTREYGNIGVTTSQAMLEAELNLRQNWNLYEMIKNDFKTRFCLLVY